MNASPARAFRAAWPRLLAALFLFWFLAIPALADDSRPFTLDVPIRCTLGLDCFVQNYFDLDPGPEFADFACGRLSYDGHTGTDFRVTPAAYARGVVVTAAADGVVAATRDHTEDGELLRLGRTVGRKRLRGREAGNAVRVKHPDGWQTQYNHLQKGSVLVHPGDTVHAGQPLGLVGLSGLTEFPHLELVVRRGKLPVCPFSGSAVRTECGDTAAALWSTDSLARLAYRASGVVAHGFLDQAPDMALGRTRVARMDTLPTDANVLYFWTVAYGVRPGDVEITIMEGPDGQVLARSRKVLEKYQAQRLTWVGVRRAGAWRPGAYVGEYTLLRGQGEGSARTVAAQARSATVAY